MQNSNVCLAGRELQTVDLELTEEQKLLQKSVREFAESEVAWRFQKRKAVQVSITSLTPS